MKKKRIEPVMSGVSDPKLRNKAIESIGRAFIDPKWMTMHFRESLYKGSQFDPEHTRIAVVNGEVAAGAVMASRKLKFGPVEVPAMSIGCVGTHPDYQKCGYGGDVLNNMTSYMEKEGYLVTYLEGIEDYYFRFGFYPYNAPMRMLFNREKARKEGRPGRLRKITKKDIPALMRIYDAVTEDRLCAAKRDKAIWEWFVGPGAKSFQFRNPYVILNGNSQICGYITINGDKGLNCAEFAVKQNEASYRAALTALAKEAKKRETKDISVSAPSDDGFAVFMRQNVATEFKRYSNPTGGQLMKIIDMPALMKKLQPLFAQRRKAAGKNITPVKFVLTSDIGKVGIEITQVSVKVTDTSKGEKVNVPQKWLSGLLTGYYTSDDIIPNKGVKIPPKLKPVIDALFPRQYPLIFKGDNY